MATPSITVYFLFCTVFKWTVEYFFQTKHQSISRIIEINWRGGASSGKICRSRSVQYPERAATRARAQHRFKIWMKTRNVWAYTRTYRDESPKHFSVTWKTSALHYQWALECRERFSPRQSSSAIYHPLVVIHHVRTRAAHKCEIRQSKTPSEK